MHAPLGDDFAVEVGQLFEQPDILQQDGATWSGSHRVLVVGHRGAGGGGQTFLVTHGFFLVARLKSGVRDIVRKDRVQRTLREKIVSHRFLLCSRPASGLHELSSAMFARSNSLFLTR